MALTAQLIADCWVKVMEVTPCPWGDDALYRWATGLPPLSYRARLDQVRRNYKGAVIPRIALVRARMLPRLKTRPRLPD